jgi:hypothetical protein
MCNTKKGNSFTHPHSFSPASDWILPLGGVPFLARNVR